MKLLFTIFFSFLLVACGTDPDATVLVEEESEVSQNENQETSTEREGDSISEEPVGVNDTKETDSVEKETSKIENIEEDRSINEAAVQTHTDNAEKTTALEKNTTTAKITVQKEEKQTEKAANKSETPSSESIDLNQEPNQQETQKATPLEEKQQEKPVAQVTIAVIGPKDVGTIIGSSKVDIKDGDTVFDILLRITKKQNIHVDYSGSGATVYVAGIKNIYEFDYGPKSGWIGKVNGSGLNKSAGATGVKSGDKVEWIYMEDYTVTN